LGAFVKSGLPDGKGLTRILPPVVVQTSDSHKKASTSHLSGIRHSRNHLLILPETLEGLSSTGTAVATEYGRIGLVAGIDKPAKAGRAELVSIPRKHKACSQCRIRTHRMGSAILPKVKV